MQTWCARFRFRVPGIRYLAPGTRYWVPVFEKPAHGVCILHPFLNKAVITDAVGGAFFDHTGVKPEGKEPGAGPRGFAIRTGALPKILRSGPRRCKPPRGCRVQGYSPDPV